MLEESIKKFIHPGIAKTPKAKKALEEATQSIQKLVSDCLPEKRNQKEEESMGIQEGYTQGFNVAVDTIEENLAKAGLI